jgi:putative hydrolase of HD superfamily
MGERQLDSQRLEQQMRFLLEIDKLKAVVRQNYLADGSRREDSAEHSWHLAMYVMALAEHFPGVDVLKATQMALIHDLVEIDAGDTFAYDETAYLNKDERERAAARRIFGLLPADQAAAMAALWEEFEAMETIEAVCAAVVDRMQPLALNSASHGKMWRSCGVHAGQVHKRNSVVYERGPAILADYVRQAIEAAKARGCFPEAEQA